MTLEPGIVLENIFAMQQVAMVPNDFSQERNRDIANRIRLSDELLFMSVRHCEAASGQR